MSSWINVWHLPCRKIYYLKHPIKFIRRVAQMFLWAFQRSTKGYCNLDWCEAGDWFLTIFPLLLRDFASKGMSWPDRSFNSIEEWHNWLREIANRLEQCSEDYVYDDESNEYTEEFHRIISEVRKRGDEELTKEEKEIRNKYFTRCEEIHNNKRKLFKETMHELIEYWDDLWD